MRLTILLMLTATGAQAHPGHIVDAAAHGPAAAGLAIGLIGLAAVLGAMKSRKGKAASKAKAKGRKARA